MPLNKQVSKENSQLSIISRNLTFTSKEKEKAVSCLKEIKREKPAFLSCPDFDSKLLNDFLSKNNSFKNLIVVGIGGSSLGTKALIELFFPLQERVFFIENLDSIEIKKILAKKLDPKETIINVISKSGHTLETRINFEIIKDKFPNSKIVATSDSGSWLHKEARNQGWDFLSIPKDLGGRFSVLSNVGLFPLGFLRKHSQASSLPVSFLKELLEGALIGLAEYLAESFEKNKVLPYALGHFLAYQQNRNNFVLFSYGNLFDKFNLWWRQLLGESLGKNKLGPNPIACLGSTDQHSLVQLFTEGPDDKIFTFLIDKKKEEDLSIPTVQDFQKLKGKSLHDILKASEKGTFEALSDLSKPCFEIEIKKISPTEMGKLIMFFEIFVALLAKMFGVNAYDQDGVEKGKSITREILFG